MPKRAIAEDRQAIKEKLIKAGIAVFSSTGFEDTTTRRIAQEAGVNHAAIAYYFSGKEEFYEACIKHIVATVSRELGEIKERVIAQSQKKHATQDEMLLLLDMFIERNVRFFLSYHDLIAMSRIVLREMAVPTFAFTHIYDGMIRPLHEALTRIVAQLTNIDAASSEAIIRAHAIMGQILCFHHARAVIQARLGIDKFSDPDISAVVKTVKFHTRAIISAYKTEAI